MKRIGCCTLCDREVAHIAERHTQPPVVGWPKRLGRGPGGRLFEPGTRRVWLILADGNHMAVTVCSDCAVTPQNLPEIHRKCLESWVVEGTNRYRVALSESEVANLDERAQWHHLKQFLHQRDNIPMGVLYEEPFVQAIGVANA